MVKIWCSLVLVFSSYGQDERFFRELYSQQRTTMPQQYTWQIWGKVFRYDLNDDGLLEGLQVAKKDQEDWFYIREHKGGVLAKYRLETKGRESRIYRVKINQIADDLKLLSLYFYNGFVEADKFYGTATLYFVTFHPSKLNSMKITKGPSIWLEYKTPTYYVQRDYQIKLQDIDRDGIKEVIIGQGHIHRIFQYLPHKGMSNIAI